MMVRSSLFCASLLVLVLTMPQAVAASPLWEWAGSPLSPGAFSGRLDATGAEAAYFNPALLRGQSSGVQFGASVLAGRLSIDLDPRPSGVDIPASVYDARLEDADGRRSPLPTRPLATEELPQCRGCSDPSFVQPHLSLGTTISLVEDRWTLGLLATVAADQFAEQRPHFVDEREQYFSNSLHFERLGDRLVGASIAIGSGVKIADWLDAGVGVTMAQDAKSDNAVFTPDPTAPEDSRVNTGISVRTRAVPHLGVEARPGGDWKMVATVHAPFENRVDGVNELRFWNFPAYPDGEDSLDQQVGYVYDYLPLRMSAGVGHGWGDEEYGISAGATVVFERWSQYRDRQGETWPDQWRNTFRPTVFGNLTRGAQSWAADVSYAPGAVRSQTGRTNFVDNHRLSLSGAWLRQMEWFGRLVQAGVQVQGHWLIEQREVKDLAAQQPVIDEFPESIHVQSGEAIAESLDFRTNNPGYPGYRASGLVFGAGLFLKTEF